MNNLVTVPQLKTLLGRDEVKNRFQEIMGKKAPGFISSILSLTNGNAQLQKAEPHSILNAAVVAATLDLPINPNLGFAAIVPYKNTAQFQLQYKGLVQLAMRSGQYKTINVSEVYEGEIKNVNRFTGDYEFGERTSDMVVGYMAYFKLVNGFEKYSYMTVDEIKEHAARYSKTYQRGDGVWKDNFDAMAKKGLALDTLIPTPNGFTTMGELKVGDIIYNALGEETKVIAKSEVKHLPCYEVEFQNGDTIVCDHEHRWFVKPASIRDDGKWKVVETKDLYGVKALGYPIVIPHTMPVKMREQELIIDPYILGYWLGNGNRCAATLACYEDDSEEIIHMFEKYYNVGVRHDEKSKTTILNISSKTGSRSDMSSLKQQLKEIGVYGNKHIPAIYKRASIGQRIELIRGLCDSDGCIDNTKRGRVKYGSVKQELTEDVYEVLCSLGERVSIRDYIVRGYGTTTRFFEVEWKPKNFNPFHLKRKEERVKDRLVYPNNSIKRITKIESVPTQCIAVDSGDAEDNDLRKSYLVGKGFNPTHNTVLKLLLSKFGILSIEMQRAQTFDQSSIKSDLTVTDVDDAEIEYVDNASQMEARKALIEDVSGEEETNENQVP